jgi:DNA-binding Xre family transcriptional regulator
LGLSRKELDVLSKNKIMLAKELLSIDGNKLTQKTGISYNRLQRLQNLVRQILG